MQDSCKGWCRAVKEGQKKVNQGKSERGRAGSGSEMIPAGRALHEDWGVGERCSP